MLSIPLTLELKADLERRAGQRPISAYARDMLFPANDNVPQASDKMGVSAIDAYSRAGLDVAFLLIFIPL